MQASGAFFSLPKADSILSHIKSQGRLKPMRMKVNSSMAQLPTFKRGEDKEAVVTASRSGLPTLRKNSNSSVSPIKGTTSSPDKRRQSSPETSPSKKYLTLAGGQIRTGEFLSRHASLPTADNRDLQNLAIKPVTTTDLLQVDEYKAGLPKLQVRQLPTLYREEKSRVSKLQNMSQSLDRSKSQKNLITYDDEEFRRQKNYNQSRDNSLNNKS